MSEHSSESTEPDLGIDNPFRRHATCDHEPVTAIISLGRSRMDIMRLLSVLDADLERGNVAKARAVIWSVGQWLDVVATQGTDLADVAIARAMADNQREDEAALQQILEEGL